MNFLLTIFDLNYTSRGAVKSSKHAIIPISSGIFIGGGGLNLPQNKKKFHNNND